MVWHSRPRLCMAHILSVLLSQPRAAVPHMFIVGLDINTRAYFTGSTSIIAIPTAIKIINWIGTIYAGCNYCITPFFFILGFLFSFTFGGFTGIILANSIIDSMLHDSYYYIMLVINNGIATKIQSWYKGNHSIFNYFSAFIHVY